MATEMGVTSRQRTSGALNQSGLEQSPLDEKYSHDRDSTLVNLIFDFVSIFNCNSTPQIDVESFLTWWRLWCPELEFLNFAPQNHI